MPGLFSHDTLDVLRLKEMQRTYHPRIVAGPGIALCVIQQLTVLLPLQFDVWGQCSMPMAACWEHLINISHGCLMVSDAASMHGVHALCG